MKTIITTVRLKKIISMTLAITLLFSTLAFAAPTQTPEQRKKIVKEIAPYLSQLVQEHYPNYQYWGATKANPQAIALASTNYFNPAALKRFPIAKQKAIKNAKVYTYGKYMFTCVEGPNFLEIFDRADGIESWLKLKPNL